LVDLVEGVSFEDKDGSVEVWSRPEKDGEVRGVFVLEDDFREFVDLLDNVTTPIEQEPKGGSCRDSGKVSMELVVEVEVVDVRSMAMNDDHSERSSGFWSSFETTMNGRFW
jgi:hypothetical protein